jgi:hypothetical protein
MTRRKGPPAPPEGPAEDLYADEIAEIRRLWAQREARQAKRGPAADLVTMTDAERVLDRIEPAWARCARGLRTGLRVGPSGDVRAQSLVTLHDALEQRRKRFEAGATMELLHAIAECAAEGVPLPDWLAVAFTVAFGQFLAPGGPASLDDVFTSPSINARTPKKAAISRLDKAIGVALYEAVGEIAHQHTGLDPALRAVLASRAWGVGMTRARTLVLEVDRTQTELSGGRVKPLSRIWAKRRNE